MKTFLPTIVIASCALAIGLAAGSLAIARSAPDAVNEEFNEEFNGAWEMAEFPMPVVGDDLFFGHGDNAACMGRDNVIAILLTDQRDYGGRTVAVAEERYQAFADNWRDRTGFDKVEVSGVVGHIFFDKSSSEWTVDVVEFDPAGCAISRTLLPGAVWTELLESTAAAV